MKINRYVNGEKTKNLSDVVVENQEVKEALAEAARRAEKAEETL